MGDKVTNVFKSISIFDEAEGTIEMNSNGWIKVEFAATEEIMMVGLSSEQMIQIAKFLKESAVANTTAVEGRDSRPV